MRSTFIERFLLTPFDNWLFDFEMNWFEKSIFKKTFVGPLIFLFGDVDNIKRNL